MALLQMNLIIIIIIFFLKFGQELLIYLKKEF